MQNPSRIPARFGRSSGKNCRGIALDFLCTLGGRLGSSPEGGWRMVQRDQATPRSENYPSICAASIKAGKLLKIVL